MVPIRQRTGDAIAVILGGGRSSRPDPLTKLRSKPAVPLAGKFLLIDVTRSALLGRFVHIEQRRGGGACMRARLWCVVTAFLFVSGAALAGTREVQYGPTPDWVLPSPAPTQIQPPEGAPVRVVYSDTQSRMGDRGTETYNAYRMKLLTPEALAAGNISATWDPAVGDVMVHYLRIFRDGREIDVLSSTKFQVIQREDQLEYSVLNGQLTATLQTPGLQVGDEIEFALTIRQKDPTLGDHFFGFAQLPTVELAGAFRIRVAWPQERTVNWQTTPDLAKLAISKKNGQSELVYELRDPKSVIVSDGAPFRVNVRRLLEYSDFSTWAELSHRLWPLFEKATILAPASPVRAEAARIAAATSDPVERAQAALKLVEDRIRYVYVGLDGGNYIPASVDDTWNRRFGDCKAKAALLLALLRELGVPGEPALVNTEGSDGTNERLPTPAAFNHVVIRVRLGSETYWLDGTGLGDQYLSLLAPPTFRWALPIRSGAVELEPVPAVAPALPQLISVLDIDASPGFDRPAKVKAQQVLRGEGVYQLHTKLAGLSAEDAERAVKAYWRQQANFVEADTVSWRYISRQATLVFSLTGEGRLDWKGDDEEGRSLTIPGAGFYPPDELRRLKEQDQDAPWMTKFPRYNCWATTIRLPASTSKWQWDYEADPVDERLGGTAYWREASLHDGAVSTVMSRRVYLPEISAKQAKEVNDRIPNFNNNMSRVFQTSAANGNRHVGAPIPPADEVDWTSPTAPCASPVAFSDASAIK